MENAAVKAYNNGIILVAAAATFGKPEHHCISAKFKTIATAASTSKNVPWTRPITARRSIFVLPDSISMCLPQEDNGMVCGQPVLL
jgi:hypothetical protein